MSVREIIPARGPVCGTIRPPGSRSLTNRALVVAALAEAYRASLVGRTAQVVIEKLLPDGGAEGLSERYVRVCLRGPLPPGAERRMIVPVRLRRLDGEFIEAEAESNAV